MYYLDKKQFVKNFKLIKAINKEAEDTSFDFLGKDALGEGDKLFMNNCEHIVKSPKNAPIMILEDTKGRQFPLPRNEVAMMIYEGYAKIAELNKAAAGEGSRGGKIIGHTKAGDPIYDTGTVKNGRQLMPDKTWHDLKTGNRHKSHDSEDRVSFVRHPEDINRAKQLIDHITKNFHPDEQKQLKTKLAKFIEAKSQASNTRDHIKQESKSRKVSEFEHKKFNTKHDTARGHFKNLKEALRTAKRKGEE